MEINANTKYTCSHIIINKTYLLLHRPSAQTWRAEVVCRLGSQHDNFDSALEQTVRTENMALEISPLRRLPRIQNTHVTKLAITLTFFLTGPLWRCDELIIR